ncbi:MAG: DNA polymerase III subunit delta', partial [Oscillospiraceae bacterium]|nr:DNA polymerase III subunit delta' [Oscillospiraceae bacterium]
MAAEILTIPGEPRLTQRVREAAERNALAHAIVISGQGDLEAAARFTAAAMQCRGTGKPCGACPACRKVMKGIHPDVTAVRDPEHKNIAVDILRDMVADAYNLPNEGNRKVFIFPDCGLLDPKAQNVLLKVVEDGPSHAAFLFCAANSAVLLPTLRSRTVEWKLSPPQAEEAGADGRAARLAELLRAGQAAEITAFFTELENSKVSREELQGLLSAARDLLAEGLAVSCGVAGGQLAREIARSMGRARMSAAADILSRFIRQCNYN